MNVNIIKHALVDEKLTVLRNKDSDNDHFRNALNDLSLFLIYESLREIHMGRKSIQTPLAPTNGWVLDNSPLIIPVVRAGLGMLDAAISLLPKSAVGFLGARRDEKTFEPEVYLNTIPKNLLGSDVLILDPMLATGGSLLHTLEIVHSAGAGNITVVCVIASQEGIANVSASQHSGNLYLAAVDEDLNENAFIVPGLGDAGDRQFGKM
ncbi:MAG: uracil phosphoribosyltransferase [Acidimicrobiaceae bacterium]|nr:MAG: uracil phosphoribosyltransferase [marine actinobacterium MedAcidi-G2A]MAT02268.1 uracil phosphoribosyltransferase [Acidimicrobiaceae bacterium]MBA4810647.1 uracil phosphoribosyltransferase [Acidimicrobiales bacterium]OUV00323.1 MAG: uracil phosphoribosyltransferase [Acidimicrobiaceae bacterium TMED77]|tara:strand:- start:1740 stop:2363 length:624 start_codon:yes stop_codon:yes gene_type:complete